MAQDLALFGGPRAVTIPSSPYPVFDQDEVTAAVRCIMSRQVSDAGRGPVITAMEEAYAAHFGVNHCLSFASGTASLHGGLFAVGVQPGDEVLCANHNWLSGITSILHAGAVPVLCDVAPGSFSIDPAEIRRKAGPHTKAVIATHLWGIPADMDGILAAARERGLAVVEDVSHAHEGRYRGQYLGTLGDVGCFSLQGSKSITAGEGGFLLTNSERYYQRAQVPGHHGARLKGAMTLPEVEPFCPGGGLWTYRMATIAAAIAIEQLKKLPTLTAARQANFDRFQSYLADLPFITWPALADGSVRGWYGTPAFFDAELAGCSRANFVKAVQAEGVNMGGEGYQDWSQIPLFQDWSLYRQVFPERHVNGVQFRQVTQGELPVNDRLRATMVRWELPAIDAPALIDQWGQAMRKVVDNLSRVAAWEPEATPA